jgi:hypothetical protein
MMEDVVRKDVISDRNVDSCEKRRKEYLSKMDSFGFGTGILT